MNFFRCQITESYAFLPRDAVTKFLAGCHICKKSPRACSPSRLDDTYCTESSSEMDMLNYSPKSLSDMSVASSEHQRSTPLRVINDGSTTNTSNNLALNSASTTEDASERNANPINGCETKSLPIPAPDTQSVLNVINALTPDVIAGGLTKNDATYVNEFYTKISEYYRGIFSNIDIKDPNISSDVLNYYQLIRQFYEQTMAAHIQRNSTVSLGSDENVIAGNSAKGPSSINLTNPKSASVDTTADPKNQSGANDSVCVNATKTKQNSPMIESNELHGNHTINNLSESLNMSPLNLNTTKTSCKTTPPKKRYMIYNHAEESNNERNGVVAKLPPRPTSFDLNSKFNAIDMLHANDANIKRRPTSENLSTKLNSNADALRNMVASEYNKSSPVASADSGSSITDVIPITSTYLQLMRSMGFSEEDAMKFDNVVSTLCLIVFLFPRVYIDNSKEQ